MTSDNSILISLGRNPVDIDNAYRQAVESGLDIEHGIRELVQNGQDYGNNIDITLNGDYVPTGKMKLNSVIVEDDGCGMDHATVFERFRGAFQNSDSHGSNEKSGRNGVGVKTNLQAWNEIHVETTTSGNIPKSDSKNKDTMLWNCKPENEKEITETFKSLSSLKPGDKDTELRRYIVTMKRTDCLAWNSVPAIQSGTKITLQKPRDKSATIVDVQELIRKLSHSIEFLDRIKHTDNSITVHYKNELNNPTMIKIRPFYEMVKKSGFICHVMGSSASDVHISVKGKQSILFPALVSDLENINFDIKIVEDPSSTNNYNDFIISICGANVYDDFHKTGPSQAIHHLISLDRFDNATGFEYRIHGFITCDDLRLKNALRHNKSALDMNDKYVKIFHSYILSLLKVMNKAYSEYLDTENSESDNELLKEIRDDFNIMISDEKQSPKGTGSNLSLSINSEWQCNDCQKTWKSPKDKIPAYCDEFNTEGESGCGSRDIQRRKLQFEGIDFKWVNFLGNFVPARYEDKEKVIYLAKYHPAFITTLSGKNSRMYKKTTGIEKALIAVTFHKANNAEIETLYSSLLKKHFQRKGSKAHRDTCVKIWKENNIDFDLI